MWIQRGPIYWVHYIPYCGPYYRRQMMETQLRLLGDTEYDIELTISTPARMQKKDNPFPKALKVQTLRCSVNFDYEKEMSKIEGAWVSENRKWGNHVPGTCLIVHKKVCYVQVLVIEASDPFYIEDDERLPTELLRPFLYPSSSSKIRDIKISNIVGLSIKGVSLPVVSVPV